MIGPQRSGRRTFAGLVLATFVAPVVTAFCLNIWTLFTLHASPVSLSDWAGGAVTFMVLALLFGGLLAILPTLVFGGATIIVARCLGTRSPGFFAVAGLLAGLFMAWVDTRRTESVFNLPEAIPFLVGGCASALAYWSVAER